MSVPVHDFHDSARWALEMAQQPWVEMLYRRAFHNFESMYIVRDDGWAQRGGIDRKINLRSARSVFIEEKFRAKDRNDFALERWSDAARRKPGWIQQNLLADFVAYVFVPSRRMYLLPYLDLRRAWVRHGRIWCRQYPVVPGVNPRYTTESIAVPIPTVLKALIEGFALQWREAAELEQQARRAASMQQLSFEFVRRIS